MQRARIACSFVCEELGGHSTERRQDCPKLRELVRATQGGHGLIAEPATECRVVDDDCLGAFGAGRDEANLDSDLLG